MTPQEIQAFSPENGDKYSPNLFQWLRKNAGGVFDIQVVTRLDRPATHHPLRRLYVGFFYDGDFNGVALMRVLAEGRLAQSLCHTASVFEPLPDFWERYKAVGRCAIDVAHDMDFLNAESRFQTCGDARTCNWCGAKQHLEREEITRVRETWKLVP